LGAVKVETSKAQTGNVELFLKNLVLFVFLVVSALVIVPLGLVWLANSSMTFSFGVLKFSGLILIGVGSVFMLNMFMCFALAGKGTPAPFAPPKRLVTKGLFRYVRNPGYIGGLMILVGEGIFLESYVVFFFAIFMGAMFHIYVIYYEEPSLKKRFGDSYKEYINMVPRWLPQMTKKSRAKNPTHSTIKT
jgi:protein-S-isoprenylcysteine O-methyltransferase Ste14